MDDNNKKQFDFDTPENVTKTYKEVEIPIETKAEKTKRITVKCLIWFFSIILINAFIVICNVFGITLGGIPIAIIYVLGFVGIKKLAKSWDEHCYYNTSLDEESSEQNQITEPTQISVEIPDTPQKPQKISLKDEKAALKIEYKDKLKDLKKHDNKNYFKLATIILSIALVITLTFTIVLTVNTTNLNNENSELKLENESLQYQLAESRELTAFQQLEIEELNSEKEKFLEAAKTMNKIIRNDYYTESELVQLRVYIELIIAKAKYGKY